MHAHATLNYKTGREPVVAAALGPLAAALGPLICPIATVLGPESVLTSPNPNIYTNLSLQL